MSCPTHSSECFYARDWLINVLVQFPIVVIIGFAFWYAANKIETNNDKLKLSERELRAEASASIQKAHRELVDSKNAEIDRLYKEIRDEIKKLVKKVDELSNHFREG